LQEAKHKEKGTKIMAKMTRRNLLAAAGAATAAVGATGLAGATSLFAQEATPKSKQHYDFKDISPRELIQRRHLPNVPLVTQDGKKVLFYDDLVKDRRVVIQFMFARCKDICPVITHHLAEVQRMLNGRVGQDIFFYSITLSPEEDSPSDLKAFAKTHGAGPGWTFLTGKPDNILHLRKSLGFFYNNPKEDADRNNHSGMVLVGTEPLTRWAMCQGGADPEWIATVVRTEMDAPFEGAVAGVRQADPSVRVNTKGGMKPEAQADPAGHVHRH
jgi:protein SCO1/2